MNEQIKAELDVFAKEATLAEAKRINGLRAVFGEVSCLICFCFFIYEMTDFYRLIEVMSLHHLDILLITIFQPYKW